MNPSELLEMLLRKLRRREAEALKISGIMHDTNQTTEEQVWLARASETQSHITDLELLFDNPSMAHLCGWQKGWPNEPGLYILCFAGQPAPMYVAKLVHGAHGAAWFCHSSGTLPAPRSAVEPIYLAVPPPAHPDNTNPKATWKLLIPVGATICEQVVAPLSRPTLQIEEVVQPDGSKKPGAHKWLPLQIVGITAEGSLTKPVWVGKLDIKLCLFHGTEEVEAYTLGGAEMVSTDDSDFIQFDSALRIDPVHIGCGR